MNKSALLSLDLALENILRFSASHPVVEVVSTFEADQRVLAEDIHSEIQVPGFDNSAMDGYAFCHADFLSHKGILQAGQRIAAGHFPEKLKQGHAIYTAGACIKCHEAMSIYHFGETRWKDIIDDMAQKALIGDEQKDAVYKYVLAIKATQPK